MGGLGCQSRIGGADGVPNELGFCSLARLLRAKESEQAQVLIMRFSEMPYPINARVDWGCVGRWVGCGKWV